jgi:hypothetical protein
MTSTAVSADTAARCLDHRTGNPEHDAMSLERGFGFDYFGFYVSSG